MKSQTDPATLFRAFWNRYSPQLARGEGATDITTGNGAPICTLVGRLGEATGSRLRAAAESLGLREHGHYLYPPGDIHTTIIHLSPYLGLNSPCADLMIEPRMDLAREIFREVLAGTRCLRFEVRGLNVFATTVFAQLFPEPGTMVEQMQRKLAGALKDAGLYGHLAAEYEANLKWGLSFANVARFTGPVTTDLIPAVERFRSSPFGRVSLSSLELVRTDKLLSSTATLSFASIDLAE